MGDRSSRVDRAVAVAAASGCAVALDAAGVLPSSAPMARRFSSIGLFGIFGRSGDLRQLDQALRAVDLHPKLVPEAVKLTTVRFLKDEAIGDEPAPQAYRAAAEVIAYCMIGPDAFAGATDEEAARRVEQRIEAALESGDSLDAKLVLLMLQAGVIQPSVVHDFQLESASD